MPNTDRMDWPYPAANQDPWYDVIVAFFEAADKSGYAHREDRHIVLMEGGTVAWDSTTTVLSWSADIEINAAINGLLWTLPAGNVNLDEGELLYVDLVRAPTQGVTVTAQVASKVPSSDQALMLAIRKGTRVYWRQGSVLEDGDSVSLFTSGGGVNTLQEVLAAGNVSGGNDIALTSGDALSDENAGDGVSVGSQTNTFGVAGTVFILAGDSGGGAGGEIQIRGGDSTSGNVGGSVRLQPGAGNPDGTIQSEGEHIFESHQTLEEVTLPSTGASEGALFVFNSDNGLYYRRENDGADVRLDRNLHHQVMAASRHEVDGTEGTTYAAQFAFDTTQWPVGARFTFGAVLSVSDGSLTGTVELFNLTDAELVTGTSQTTSSTDPTILETASLTPGASAGDLKISQKIYEVRISTDGTLSSEITFLGSAWMRIEDT